jgi:hypothetical protein
VPVNAPPQYGTGRCRIELGGCGRPLSTYNPYVVCGPCRVRLASTVDDDSDNAELIEREGQVWERFPKRGVARRGALLPETGGGKEIVG